MTKLEPFKKPTVSYKTADLIRQGIIEIGDGYRAKNSEMGLTGLPFARAGNIVDGFRFQDVDLLAQENLVNVGPKVSQPSDIVFTSKGTVGRFAMVQDTTPQFVYSPQLCYWRVKNTAVIHPRFLYYWMQSDEFQQQINSVKGQTDMAEYVSLADQRRMTLTLPPLAEQQAIAATLGALDDKIELNRRMNQTLEDLGRTLFQAWFVDFAPVRAKREGRQPEGMYSETAALFPAEFQDSPLGPIPKGWGSKTLGNIAAPIRSGVEPGDMSPETPYIGLEHMPRRSIALAEWGHAGDVGSGKSRFHAGDILFGKLRPYFHKVGVALMDGVCSTDIVVIRPQEQKWHGFILFQVSSTEFVNYTDSHSAGTKMPRTNWQDMSRYEIVQPPATIALAFNNLVQPLVARISANVAEIHTLAALRDTLLPRLLSGEMRVTEIEETV